MLTNWLKYVSRCKINSMGTLYIVSTPIGNMEDITIRAIKTLFSVDIIACEDTRRTGILLRQVKKYIDNLTATATRLSMVRFDDHTENQKTPWLIEQLLQGKNVALISDAGTPLISDPGYRLVSECVKRGINVISIPGPTAAIAALSVSGLPTNHFMFLGYPPEKQSHRLQTFSSLPKNTTIIFYCAPHKFHQTLGDMQTVQGDIPIVICRELTKFHEEIWRGKISEALNHFSVSQGEFALLLQRP